MKSNNELLISVCVPVYNVEKYIERCAVSLFEQTYDNIEYIFVDDCSPDHSIEILNAVINQYPKRKPQVRIVKHDTNKGLGCARNTAVQKAKGAFILHVDSDDYIDCDTIEKLLRKQIETGADIVKYPKKVLYPGKVETVMLRDYTSPRQLLCDILEHKTGGNVWGLLIRTSLYRENNIEVKGGVNYSEDYQITPQLLYHAKSLTTVNDVFYYYDRTNETSYCNNLTRESFRQKEVSSCILDDFFYNRQEHYLQKIQCKGLTIVLCRSKMSFCKTQNKEMYNHACVLLDKLKSKDCGKLPLKYKPIIWVRNYNLFYYMMKVIMNLQK